MTATLTCPECGRPVPLTGRDVICPGCGEKLPAAGLGGDAPALSGRELGKSEEQRAIEFYESLGCAVYKTSQPRRAIGMTPGIPDLIVFRERCQIALAPFWFHEVKAGSGRLDPDQRLFRDRCEAADVPHVVGDAAAAAEFLGLEVHR